MTFTNIQDLDNIILKYKNQLDCYNLHKYIDNLEQQCDNDEITIEEYENKYYYILNNLEKFIEINKSNLFQMYIYFKDDYNEKICFLFKYKDILFKTKRDIKSFVEKYENKINILTEIFEDTPDRILDLFDAFIELNIDIFHEFSMNNDLFSIFFEYPDYYKIINTKENLNKYHKNICFKCFSIPEECDELVYTHEEMIKMGWIEK